MEPAVVKDIVLNARKPVVFRNLPIPWRCFGQSLEQWLAHLDQANDGAAVQFDSGPLRNGSRPQWERTRGKVPMTMGEFYGEASSGTGLFGEHWASYSYRYVQELPAACREGVDFAAFGFPEVGEDVSFWIGSRGAHTPCHYDTYGCNVVVQVHGRKRWLMFPPGTKALRKSRVPYEESSVYCEENFYSPASYSEVIGVENEAYHVVLEPGMAVVVPPKWWHFVENLECSLNFNTWIPLVGTSLIEYRETDADEQISECVTRMIIQNYTEGLSDDTLRHIINPNELETIDSTSNEELHAALDYLLSQKSSSKRQKLNQNRHPWGYLPESDLESLLSSHRDFVHPVQKLENHEFYALMKRNGSRYDAAMNRSSDDEEDNQLTTRVINRSCNPELMELIKVSLCAE